MSEPTHIMKTCPQCQQPMSDDAPEGLCPQCLLRQAVGESSSAPTILVGAAQPGSLRAGDALRYFGNYELLEEVGVGGMGVVWKARQASLNRVVALKMIRGGMLANAEEVKRFRAEAQAAANLQHPNIVAIHEIGEQDGQHYYSMDFIQGRSLHALCDGRPLEPERAAQLLATVAGAVEFAHRAQILHRDLKPHNVMMDAEGVPHLTDFGLAKRMDVDSGMTQTGAIMGSPSYMAPEQAQGRNDAVGPRTDVYSLGAILYETLTGRPPFQAATALDTVRQVVDAEPAPPRSVNPSLPADLETICLKCLEKDPSRRYATAQEVADELGRFLRHEPIKARPATRIERVRKWAKRKPASAALVAVSVAALLALIGSGMVFYGKLRERLRLSLIEQARSERLVNHRPRALELLTEAARIRRDAALRGEAIQTIAHPGLRRVLVLPFGQTAMSRFSPDGTRLAVGGQIHSMDASGKRTDTNRVRVWEIPSGRVLGETEWDAGAGLFAWSPDSRHLAVQRPEGEMAVWDPQSGGRVAWPAAGAPSFNADGTRLAVSGKDAITVFDTATGHEVAKRAGFASVLRLLPSGEILLQAGPGQFVWNPITGAEKPLGADAERILTSSADGTVVAVEITDGVSLRDTLTHAERARFVFPSLLTSAFYLSPDGGRLLFQDTREFERLRIWDTVTGKFLPGMREQGIRLVSPFLGLELGGDGFGFAGWRGSLVPSTEAPWPSGSRHFSSDGAWFAAEAGTGEQQVMVWDVNTGAKVATLSKTSHPEWSEDGRWLAVSGDGFVPMGNSSGMGGQMMVEVWEAARSTTDQRLAEPVRSISWRPDSRRLSANETLWDVEERAGRSVLRRVQQDVPAQMISFFPSGEVWAMDKRFSQQWYGAMRFTQIAPGGKVLEVPNPGQIGAPDFSPDGKMVLVGTASNDPQGAGKTGVPASVPQFELWDLNEAKRIAVWPAKGAFGRNGPSAFSPDGKHVASAYFVGTGIEIRDVATGAQLQHLHRPEQMSGGQIFLVRLSQLLGMKTKPYLQEWTVRAITFTPDSRLVISTADNCALIRDVASGKELAECNAGEKNIICLAISPDGRTLATGDEGRMIRLWEIPSGRELAHWQAHEAAVTALAFSPDGRKLASGGNDGTLKLWNLPSIRRELAEMGLDW